MGPPPSGVLLLMVAGETDWRGRCWLLLSTPHWPSLDLWPHSLEGSKKPHSTMDLGGEGDSSVGSINEPLKSH